MNDGASPDNFHLPEWDREDPASNNPNDTNPESTRQWRKIEKADIAIPRTRQDEGTIYSKCIKSWIASTE